MFQRADRLLRGSRPGTAVLLRRLRDRIIEFQGRPLWLALAGWALSLALAYAIGGVLAAAGIVLSLLYTGSALSTTRDRHADPDRLSDSGELRARFGTYLLAAGAVGEFGPILLLTLILSTQGTLHNALILIAFVALAVAVAIFAVRSAERTLPAFRADAGEQLTAGRALDRRAGLRARAAGLRTGTRPAARGLRRRHHHPPGAQRASCRASTPSSPRLHLACSCPSSSWSAG